MEAQKKRYCLVDGIRGVAIVNMAVFHFLYDVFIVCIVGLKPSPLGETFR